MGLVNGEFESELEESERNSSGNAERPITPLGQTSVIISVFRPLPYCEIDRV
jgi:hypothetical protein